MDIDVTVPHAFASPGCGGHLVDIFFSLPTLYIFPYIYFLEISSVLCSLVSVNLNLASAAEVSKHVCLVVGLF